MADEILTSNILNITSKTHGRVMEIYIVFCLQVFVWPYLSKLPVEGIHSPTSLLKLFTIWSQVPRYVWNVLLLCTVWFKFNEKEQKFQK